MVTLTIDGREVTVPEHTSILDAAKQAGINIPTLCYLKDLNEIGACRVCVVEVEGIDQLVASCNNDALDGMVVHTNSPKVREARWVNIDFILSQHNSLCTSCVRSGNCSLQSLANDLNIYELPFTRHLTKLPWNRDFPLIRSNQKCIKCMRCINICEKVQTCNIWDLGNRATHTTVNVRQGLPIDQVDCTLCGQCITHCPVGALRERDDTQKVFDALADPDKIVIAQIAPSVRTSWAEPFGLTPEESPVELLVAALKPMGFDYIFNTDFSADLTIMEEGSELLERLPDLRAKGLPMFTSCCPGWVRFIKGYYPQLVDQLSTSKSPQAMFGAIIKSYYAQLLGVDPHNIYCVSIMPCVAKKAECAIPALNDACGDPDVDCVLTIREVDRMIRSEHVNVRDLEPMDFDAPLGVGSGAGAIFGATGGVMEAALRTAHYLVTGRNPKPDAFKDVRGLKGWKEATFDMAGTAVRVAVVSGLGNTRRLLDALLAGEVSYDFVEVMACPGGCVGGGGHPIHDGEERAGTHGEVLYGLDKRLDLRFSHENPEIVTCYRDFLGKPLSEKAEQLLHTDQHAWEMPGEMRYYSRLGE
ncbi:MAG: [FeFe] hydrogenase, group A [Coriobacteriales bacterium]|nr:[FeFe] hydrogenase, group A [Coriobacteriales bacterium]